MRRFQVLLAAGLVLIAGVSGCFSYYKPPWIGGISREHPSEKYIVGVGMGQNMDAARSAALAEIAKVFRSQVAQTGTSMQREGLDDRSRRSSGSDATMTTNVSTSGELEGAEVVETWQDPRQGGYYALAVLNKHKTRMALTGAISDVESALATQLAAADAATTPVERARAYNRALDLSLRREELAAKRRVVDAMAGGDIPLGPGRSEIERRRLDALVKIVFAIETDPSDPALAALLARQATGKGLNVASEGAAAGAGLVARAVVTGAPVDRANPEWKFYSWQATLQTTVRADGSVAASGSVDGQSSHLTADGARQKAQADAAAALAREFDRQLDEYLFK